MSLVYAELLIHVHQLAVYGSFLREAVSGGGGVGTAGGEDEQDGAAAAQPRLLLAPNGRVIVALDEGKSLAVFLPSRVAGAAAGGVRFVSGKTTTQFSARLTLGNTTELDRVIGAREEGIEAPWSATDLNGAAGAAADIRCKQCTQVIVTGGRVEEWKDLPNEHWADLMDLWFCHKPHVQGEDEAGDGKGFGARSKLRLRQGIGLVDVLSLLLHQEDCCSVKVLSSPQSMECNGSDLVVCEKCTSFLGSVSQDADQRGYRLFKSAISVQARSYEPAVFVGAQLLHLIQNSVSRRVVIHAAAAATSRSGAAHEHGQGILAWVFIPDMYYYSYASSSPPPSPARPPSYTRAIKLLYRVIDRPLDLVDAPTSTVEELALPPTAYAQFRAAIEASAHALLPASARTFKLGAAEEWNVALVERWERAPSGRGMVDQSSLDSIMSVDADGWKDLAVTRQRSTQSEA